MSADAHAHAGLTALRSREQAALVDVYRRLPVAAVGGSGCWLADADGGWHLDMVAGIAACTLGHAHPGLADAVARQAATLVHTSNLVSTEPAVELAERLQRLVGWPDARSFLCSSGAEANEAAIKLTRRHGRAVADDKVEVVALRGAFHGRTLGALALTDPSKHPPFEPLGDWVRHVDPDDPAALEAAVGPRTCAVWVEVVQGEGGVRPVPEATLRAARAACDRHGAVLVADEVQTGVGRLGAPVGFRSLADPAGCEPDVVLLAKGLAGGLPIGAVVARGAAAGALGPGEHGSTFGGGPLACAAACEVLDAVERDQLAERAEVVGAHLADGLERLAGASALATGQRGAGLLRALTLAEPVAARVVDAAVGRRLLVNAVAADAVRLTPPLVITVEEVDEALRRLGAALDDVERAGEHGREG